MIEDDIAKFYERVKWIYKVFYRLHREKYTGPVRFNVFQGNLSDEWKREITERAPK